MQKLIWRKIPITIEQWKENCSKSEHLRKGETLSFTERDGKVSCWIENSNVFLGTYFINGEGNDILPGTGWNH